MGHGDVRNLSEIFIKRIYAKGKISLKELDEWLVEKIKSCKTEEKKAQYGFQAGEGLYEDYDNIGIALEMIILHFLEENIIEGIPETLKQKALFKESGELIQTDDFETFDTINWKFTLGSRKKYLEHQITHLGYIEE